MKPINSLLVAKMAFAILATASSDPAAAQLTEQQSSSNLLFWSPSQQVARYPHLDDFFPSRLVRRGVNVRGLPLASKPLEISFDYDHRPYTVDDFFKVNRASGILVIKDGVIVLEHYASGRTANDRWPTFSMTKSITSTLVGAALADGTIKSLDDQLTSYLPALRDTEFAGVTIRQALMMASGVAWTEDYDDPNSDRAKIGFMAGPAFLAEMKGRGRDFPAGSKFRYATMDTIVLGSLLEAATGETLSGYLSRKIWVPAGMEADASWMLFDGHEIAGTCLSATLRDVARFGLFVLEKGRAGGTQVTPATWFDEATTAHIATEYDNASYGYQWWVHSDGTFEAVGIMGQSMRIDPASKTIIVIQSAWNNAGTDEQYRLQEAFQVAVLKTVRGE